MLLLKWTLVWVACGFVAAFWVYRRLHILLFKVRDTHRLYGEQKKALNVVLQFLQQMTPAGCIELGLICGVAWVFIAVGFEGFLLISASRQRLEIRRREAA